MEAVFWVVAAEMDVGKRALRVLLERGLPSAGRKMPFAGYFLGDAASIGLLS